MLVSLQVVGTALVPLKVTTPDPGEAPKLLPVMVTEAPTLPDVGEMLVMAGVSTVKLVAPLLESPPAF
jgi:hypothetical protein